MRAGSPESRCCSRFGSLMLKSRMLDLVQHRPKLIITQRAIFSGVIDGLPAISTHLEMFNIHWWLIDDHLTVFHGGTNINTHTTATLLPRTAPNPDFIQSLFSRSFMALEKQDNIDLSAEAVYGSVEGTGECNMTTLSRRKRSYGTSVSMERQWRH